MEANQVYRIIQKHLILDTLGDLFKELNVHFSNSTNTDKETDYLRFITHMILYLQSVGLDNYRSDTDELIKKYIFKLESERKGDLVAFYYQNLNEIDQLNGYSSFLSSFIILT
jgi:hypothetical protein